MQDAVGSYIRGAVGKYPECFYFSKKKKKKQQQKKNFKHFSFSKHFLLFFKVFPTYICTFCHLRWSFCIPSANHKVDLLLRYRFIAEIKAALVSYLLPVSISSVVETAGGNVWAVRRVGQQLPLELLNLISSTVDEAVWEEALACTLRKHAYSNI